MADRITTSYKRSILVVDCEAVVLDFIAKALGGVGYRAIAARNSAHAWSLFHEHASELALMMIEATLPGCADFIGNLPTREPRIPVVFTTCMAEPEDCRDLPGPVLRKPFQVNALRRTIWDYALS